MRKHVERDSYQAALSAVGWRGNSDQGFGDGLAAEVVS